MKIKEILIAKTLDLRILKPSYFSRLIWWFSFRKIIWINKKDRWNHCLEYFKILWEDGTITHEALDADKKYKRTNYFETIKEYKIINECDTVKAFNLTQEEIQGVYWKFRSFVGTKYGVVSIFGLAWHQITKRIKMGIDGSESLICSESSIRGYLPYLKVPDNNKEPFDYWDPYERGKLFPMKRI